MLVARHRPPIRAICSGGSGATHAKLNALQEGEQYVARRWLVILVSLCLAGCVEEEVATPGTAVASMDEIHQGPPELSTAAPRSPRRALQTPAPPVAQDPHVIRTCEAADGSLSYQDMPCVDGSNELARRIVAREDASVARRAAQSEANAIADARRVAEIAYGRGGGSRTTTYYASESADDRCERARVRAKQMRDEHRGLPDIDWLRRLDAWVQRECADTNSWTRLNTSPKG